MASKLRQSSARVSFFSFQDMITTVTGVLIIVMLMLSLEVTSRAERATDPAREQLQRGLQQARKKLAENTELLHQRQVEIAALAHRVFVLPKPDPSGKQPVLVVLSAAKGFLTRVGQTNVTEFALGRGGAGFEQALATCNPNHDRLVFYVRPSGIEQFQNCRKFAEQQHFQFGYDAAEEDAQYLLTQ